MNYYCECCQYSCKRQYDFTKHLNTKKHNKQLKMNHFVSQKLLVNSQVQEDEIHLCKYCNKSFKFSQGLSRHIKYHCKKIRMKGYKN